MAEPAKFNFELDFQPDGNGLASMPRAYREEDLDAARSEGHAAGYTAGQGDAAVRTEQEIKAVLENVATSCRTILDTLDAETDRLRREAADLALTVAGKLTHALMAREPLVEIEALLDEALSHLSGAPRVTILVNDLWIDRIEPRLAEIAAAKGFEGRMVVLGSPEVSLVDCRIEWQGGGLARDSRAMHREIKEIVERHFPIERDGDDVPEFETEGEVQ